MKEPERKPHGAWPPANTPVSPSEINTLACFSSGLDFPLYLNLRAFCYWLQVLILLFLHDKKTILCFLVCFEESKACHFDACGSHKTSVPPFTCHHWNLQQAAFHKQIEIEHRDSSKHALIMFMQLLPRHGREGGFRSGSLRRVREDLPKRSGPQTGGREGGRWGHPLGVHL